MRLENKEDGKSKNDKTVWVGLFLSLEPTSSGISSRRVPCLLSSHHLLPILPVLPFYRSSVRKPNLFSSIRCPTLRPRPRLTHGGTIKITMTTPKLPICPHLFLPSKVMFLSLCRKLVVFLCVSRVNPRQDLTCVADCKGPTRAPDRTGEGEGTGRNPGGSRGSLVLCPEGYG